MRIGLMRDVPALFSGVAAEGDGQMQAAVRKGMVHRCGKQVLTVARWLVRGQRVGDAMAGHSEPTRAAHSRRVRSVTMARSPLPSNSICSTVRRMTRPSALSLRFVLRLVT